MSVLCNSDVLPQLVGNFDYFSKNVAGMIGDLDLCFHVWAIS